MCCGEVMPVLGCYLYWLCCQTESKIPLLIIPKLLRFSNAFALPNTNRARDVTVCVGGGHLDELQCIRQEIKKISSTEQTLEKLQILLLTCSVVRLSWRTAMITCEPNIHAHPLLFLTRCQTALHLHYSCGSWVLFSCNGEVSFLGLTGAFAPGHLRLILPRVISGWNSKQWGGLYCRRPVWVPVWLKTPQ